MTKARSPTTRTIQPANGKTRIGTGYLLSRRHTKWRATPCRRRFFPYVPRCQDVLQTRPSRWSASERHRSGPAARMGRRARVHRPSSATTGAADVPPGAAAPSAVAYYSVRCMRYAARLVHGAAHARARMCGQRARHATRAAGSVVAATADAVADAQSGVVDVVETQGGGLWRTTVQGSLRRWKNLVILKHKLDVRADAGVAT